MKKASHRSRWRHADAPVGGADIILRSSWVRQHRQAHGRRNAKHAERRRRDSAKALHAVSPLEARRLPKGKARAPAWAAAAPRPCARHGAPKGRVWRAHARPARRVVGRVIVRVVGFARWPGRHGPPGRGVGVPVGLLEVAEGHGGGVVPTHPRRGDAHHDALSEGA